VPRQRAVVLAAIKTKPSAALNNHLRQRSTVWRTTPITSVSSRMHRAVVQQDRNQHHDRADVDAGAEEAQRRTVQRICGGKGAWERQ